MSRSQILPCLCLFVIAMLGLIVRLHGLVGLPVQWEESFFTDGDKTFPSFQHYSSPMWLFSGAYFPTFIYFAYAFSEWVSPALPILRLANIVLWLLSNILLFRTGLRLHGFQAAAIAAAIHASSAVTIWWDQTFLPYSTSVSLFIISLYFFLTWRERRHGWTLAAHLLFSNIFVSLHLLNILYLLPTFLILLHDTRYQVKLAAGWLAAHIFVALLACWWVVPNMNYLVDYNDYVYPSLTLVLRQGLGSHVLGYVIEHPMMPQWQALPHGIIQLCTTLVAGSGFGLAGLSAAAICMILAKAILGANPKDSRRDTPWLLLAYFVIPIATISLLSYMVRPVYAHRFILSSSPILFLLIGVFIAELKQPILKRALLASLLASMLVQLALLKTSSIRGEWYLAAQEIEKKARPGDVTLVLGEMPAFGHSMYAFHAGEGAVSTARSVLSLDEAAAAVLANDNAQSNFRLFIEYPREQTPQVLQEFFLPMGLALKQSPESEGRLSYWGDLAEVSPSAAVVVESSDDGPSVDSLDNGMYLCLYAIHCMESDRFQVAEEALIKAASVSPRFPYTAFCRGILEGLKGEKVLAQKYFDESFARDYRALSPYEDMIKFMYAEPTADLLAKEIALFERYWYPPAPLLRLARIRLDELKLL
jgi:hypothetical protein